jgi:NADH dehydrogenase
MRYRDKGNLATIGRSRAVADVRGIRVAGFPAWLLWLGVHLPYLLGFQTGCSWFSAGRAAT